jgi:hypothetical protein
VIRKTDALLLQLCAPLKAQESKKVRMAYSAFSISFLNIFVARAAGLFKKHGLDVELMQMVGPLPVAALAAGEIDYLTGYTTGIVATGQGAPLRGIVISLRKPPFFLVAEPAVQRPADLAGKRIGVDRIGSLQHLVARLMLKTKTPIRRRQSSPKPARFRRGDEPPPKRRSSDLVWPAQRDHDAKGLSSNRLGGRAANALSHQWSGGERCQTQDRCAAHQEHDPLMLDAATFCRKPGWW